MKYRVPLSIAAGLVLLVAAAILFQHLPRETKDRLSPEALAQMVEGPAFAVREGGLAVGEAQFERLLSIEAARPGANGVRIADLYMAFGVALHDEWMATDNRALLQASRDYVRESIARYRAAFGPAHPEVAVALHSFADVDIELNDGRLSPEAEAALGEAVRIRRAALGPRNAETRAAEERLARARNEANRH